MILKGGPRTGSNTYARGLAAHVARTDTNESVVTLDIRGTVAGTIEGALEEMAALGLGVGCRRSLYHLNIDPDPGKPHLTLNQEMVAVETAERELGFAGQPRLIVEHIKEGRQHLHVVWSRIDLDRMRVISDSWNYLRHEKISRVLEEEFGHDRVQGAFVDRNETGRPAGRPSDAEVRQGERTGIAPHDARMLAATAWEAAADAAAFIDNIGVMGWSLARGDKRVFVLVDPQGGAHSLARLVGQKTADVQARMLDLGLESLPSVTEAREEAGRRREVQEAAAQADQARVEADRQKAELRESRRLLEETAQKKRDAEDAERQRKWNRKQVLLRRQRLPELDEPDLLIARALRIPLPVEGGQKEPARLLTRVVTEPGLRHGRSVDGPVDTLASRLEHGGVGVNWVRAGHGWQEVVVANPFSIGRLFAPPKTRADVALYLGLLRAARRASAAAAFEGPHSVALDSPTKARAHDKISPSRVSTSQGLHHSRMVDRPSVAVVMDVQSSEERVDKPPQKAAAQPASKSLWEHAVDAAARSRPVKSVPPRHRRNQGPSTLL